jgi:hypothetical protein
VTDPYFAARRVLIAEDELLIAVDLAEAFEREGQRSSARSLLSKKPCRFSKKKARSISAFSISIWGELVYPLADELVQRNIPFMFTTGYDAGAIPSRFEDVIRLEKPATGEAAVESARKAFPASGLAAGSPVSACWQS